MKSFAIAFASLLAGASANMPPPAPAAYPAAPAPPAAYPAQPAAGTPVAAWDMAASPVAAAAGAAVTHMVVVGGVANGSPMLTYQPEWVKAAVGDVVKFQFMAKNHTVTQSTFDTPCVRNPMGQDSGFMPNMDNSRTDITWEMPVTTTDAQWFYCKQREGNHCGKGMMFAINPAEAGDKTFANFKALGIAQNGTAAAPPAGTPPPAAPPAPAVTISAGGAAATPGVAPPAAPAAPAAAPSVVPGAGQKADGSSCSCSCLCGAGSFPAGAGVNSFGGFGGMMSPVK